MTAQATIIRALGLARERSKADPDFDIYRSIISQIEYLEAWCVAGRAKLCR